MPHHERVTVSGTVADVFAHRFVLDTPEGRMLADLTPKGAERVLLRPGARVTVSGERKPSEIKVHSIALDGGEPVTIESGKRHEDSDGEPARRSAEAAGYAVIAAPRRKPKHWEVLGRGADGVVRELHLEPDGTLRKTGPADPAKWPEHIPAPAMPAGDDAGRP